MNIKQFKVLALAALVATGCAQEAHGIGGNKVKRCFKSALAAAAEIDGLAGNTEIADMLASGPLVKSATMR